jgi:hypothetical protein
LSGTGVCDEHFRIGGCTQDTKEQDTVVEGEKKNEEKNVQAHTHGTEPTHTNTKGGINLLLLHARL